MNNQTETHIPWGKDSITIKGNNAGAETLIVYFDNETLKIIDFLNNSLIAEYAAIYEEIMSRYEAKLNGGNLFDNGFPEATFTPEKIEPSNPDRIAKDDKGMIDALLNEYNIYLAHIKERFKEYEVEVEIWFNTKNQ